MLADPQRLAQLRDLSPDLADAIHDPQLWAVRYAAAAEAERAARAEAAPAARDAIEALGFSAAPAQGGVVVATVDAMGPAAEVLPRGFRIQKLNGRDIRSLEDLREAATRLRAGSTVSIVGRAPDGPETIVNYRLRG